MNRISVLSLVALALAADLSAGPAAAPIVGVITAKGAFQIDDSSLSGSATLYGGSRVRTLKSTSQLHLNNGARVQLSADSAGIVYKDRLILEKGSGQIYNGGGYRLEADMIRVEGSDASSARVSVLHPERVEVAAGKGQVDVYKSDGVLLARLEAGKSLTFAPEASGAAAPSKLTGCLAADGGKFLLKDEVSTVTFQLLGDGLASNVSQRIEISGTLQQGDTKPSRVKVHAVKILATKCGSGAAAAKAGTTAAGPGSTTASKAGAAVGLSTASKAVIAGVVIAGAGTGVAVAAINSEEETISPSSR